MMRRFVVALVGVVVLVTAAPAEAGTVPGGPFPQRIRAAHCPPRHAPAPLTVVPPHHHRHHHR